MSSFLRSKKEDELSFQFSQKYSNEISELEQNIVIEKFAIRKLTPDEVSAHIRQCNFALDCFDRLQKFCYGHGKGGKIYFEDMWERCYNAKNPCFSFRERILEALEKLEQKKQEEAAQ